MVLVPTDWMRTQCVGIWTIPFCRKKLGGKQDQTNNEQAKIILKLIKMENINRENPRYATAVERVQKIKKFYTCVLVFAIVFGIIYGIKFFKQGFPQNLGEMQVSWIFIIWGLILAIKGIKLFFFNSDWENDMINKEMKKQSNGNY